MFVLIIKIIFDKDFLENRKRNSKVSFNLSNKMQKFISVKMSKITKAFYIKSLLRHSISIISGAISHWLTFSDVNFIIIRVHVYLHSWAGSLTYVIPNRWEIHEASSLETLRYLLPLLGSLLTWKFKIERKLPGSFS